MSDEALGVALAANRLASAAASAVRTGRLGYPTWLALSGVTTSTLLSLGDGQIADVPSTDTGTHTDPVTGATVNNSGVFRWVAAKPGWQRIYDSVDAQVQSATATVLASAAAMDVETETLENTLSAFADTSGRWSLREMPDGSIRIQKLALADGTRIDTLPAQIAAVKAITDLLTLFTEVDEATFGALADTSGRWATREMPDGSFRIQKPALSDGTRIDTLLAAHTGSIASLQASIALLPAPNRSRIKKTLLSGRPRQVMASDPITVGAPTIYSSGPSITGGPVLPRDDTRIRRVGGRTYLGTGTPGSAVVYPNSTHYNAASTNGSGVAGFEVYGIFDALEYLFLDSLSSTSSIAVEIDGVATNDAGYSDPGLGTNGANSGNVYYRKITLPHTTVARRVRIKATRPLGEVRFPAGATVLDPTPLVPSTCVFIGDSITEGSVSTRPWYRYGEQAGYRLGFSDTIVSGVGGTGLITAGSGHNAGYTDYVYDQRLQDVLQAVNGGPPDCLIVGGNLNDNNQAAADIQAASLKYFSDLRAGAPNMPIFVCGPLFIFDKIASLPATQTALFAGASQVSDVYTIDTSTWLTDSMEGTYYRTGFPDGPHPIDPGHAYIGQRVADAVRPLIAALY